MTAFSVGYAVVQRVKTLTTDTARAMNKQIRHRRRCLGIAICGGGVPGGQAEYVRCAKGNVGPFKVPPLFDDKALFLIFCLPPAGMGKMPRFSKVPAWRFWRRAGRITDHRLCAPAGRGADSSRRSPRPAACVSPKNRYGAIPINPMMRTIRRKIIEQTADTAAWTRY